MDVCNAVVTGFEKLSSITIVGRSIAYRLFKNLCDTVLHWFIVTTSNYLVFEKCLAFHYLKFYYVSACQYAKQLVF